MVIVGDSFVAGLGVEDQFVFSARLERMVNPQGKPIQTEVINLGRAGSSTVREADLYETLGRPFQPDVVILAVFVGNDLPEILEEQDAQELHKWRPAGLVRGAAYWAYPNLYLELAMRKAGLQSQQQTQVQTKTELWKSVQTAAEHRGLNLTEVKTRFDQKPTDILEHTKNGMFSHSNFVLACLEPERLENSLSPDQKFIDQAWPKMQQHLNRLHSAVESDGAKFLVMLIPHSVQVDPKAWAFNQRLGFEVQQQWLTEPTFLQQEIPNWCQAHQVPCLDLAPSLREEQRTVYFPQDGHWNKFGHETAAKQLLEWKEFQSALHR